MAPPIIDFILVFHGLKRLESDFEAYLNPFCTAVYPPLGDAPIL